MQCFHMWEMKISKENTVPSCALGVSNKQADKRLSECESDEEYTTFLQMEKVTAFSVGKNL